MPRTKKLSADKRRELQRLRQQEIRVKKKKESIVVASHDVTPQIRVLSEVPSDNLSQNNLTDASLSTNAPNVLGQVRKEAVKINMRKQRLHNEYKEKEKESNKLRMENLRKTQEYDDTAKLLIATQNKRRRLNEDYKKKENESNKMRMQALRQKEVYREQEKMKDKQNKTNMNEIEKLRDTLQTRSSLGSEKFEMLIKEGSTQICACCDRLWFPRTCCRASRKFITSKFGEDLWNAVFNQGFKESQIVCSSCHDIIYKGKVPRFCSKNFNIIFPIPLELKNLTILEERLISPRLPFMQIKRLGYDRQCSIKGQIVNVPITADTTVKALPRNVDDTGTIQLKLKRKMGYERDYIVETVRPKVVIRAAEYLVQQPLYKELGINLANNWTNVDNSDGAIANDDVDEQCDDLDEELKKLLNEFEQDDLFDQINPGGEQTLLDNENLENLALAPGENKVPLNLTRDPYAEELSFPTLFCGNKKTFKVKLSYSEVAKIQAAHHDRRFARTDFLLYMYKKETLFHVISNISMAIRQKRAGADTYTAKNVKSKQFLDNLIQHDGGFNFLQKIAASPAHWQKEKRKVMSMIRQFNIPTLFITISAAETMWPELLVILSKLVENKDLTEDQALKLSHNEKVKLIRTDPVTCARYFNNRFRILFKHLKSAAGPFKEHPIEHFYYRVEFQHRGSPHVHGLLWLKDAPICDFSNFAKVKQCESFIAKYITCDSSLKSVEDLILYQTHHHSKSCKREFKQVVSCRYGIPFLPMDQVTILVPNENKGDEKATTKLFVAIKKFLNNKENVDISFQDFLSKFSLTRDSYLKIIKDSIRKPMVFLKREVKDCFINPFNEEIFSLMKSNMDIQFILDPYACCSYIINYINKAERGVSLLMREAIQEIRKGNDDIKQQLQKLGNVFMNASEVSAQEAAYNVLKLHMSETSSREVYITTQPPEQRVRMLKPKTELAQMSDDDTDIYQKGVLDHYAVRPDELENLCLAEFAAFYNVHTINANTKSNVLKLKDYSRWLFKKQSPNILSFSKYGVQQDPVNFYRQQLMLYLPWRNEDTELINVNQEQIYVLSFDRIKENRLKFDVLDTALLDEAYENAAKNVEDVLLDGGDDDDDDTSLDPEFMAYGIDQPDVDILHGIINPDDKVQQPKKFPTPFQLSDDEYSELVCTLNEKQCEYLTHVLRKVKNGNELYEVVSGGAGVGKSRLINAIYQSVLRHFNSIPGNNPESIKVLLTAPTGKASFNINGMTLHSVLSLPIKQSGESLVPLSSDTVNTLFTKLSDLKLMIIDEFSMVGSKMFSYINSRLQQIFKSKEDFAGISILLVGDLRQLPPVGDQWIFMTGFHDPYAVITGNQLWEKFRYFELTEIMRQRDDKRFAVALNNMAVGEMTIDDVKLFRTRITKVNEILPETTIHLFRSNKEVDEFNAFKLESYVTERATSRATDMVKGSCSDKVKQRLLREAKGLHKSQNFGLSVELVLQVDAKYMVSLNVNVADGLVNGATGILRKLEKDKRDKPCRVWMEFSETRVGKETRKKYKTLMLLDDVPDNWTPVERAARAIDVQKGTNITVERKQFPLTVAEGITIHKSQGSTYTNVAVHLKPGMPRNALYVACSRATNLSGLFLFGTFQAPQKPSHSDRSHVEIQNLRSNKFLVIDFVKQINESGKVTLTYQNIQSFNKNAKYVKNNPLFRRSDIILFVETWVNATDDITIDDFVCFSSKIRNPVVHKPFGILCYRKSNVKVKLLKEVTEICEFRVFQAVVFKILYTTVIVIYVPPKFKLRKAEIILRKLLSEIRGDCVIVGDFNCDATTNDSNCIKTMLEQQTYQTTLDTSSPTTKSLTHIDWCFSNNCGTVKSCVYDTVYSHHSPIVINVYENVAAKTLNEQVSCQRDAAIRTITKGSTKVAPKKATINRRKRSPRESSASSESDIDMQLIDTDDDYDDEIDKMSISSEDEQPAVAVGRPDSTSVDIFNHERLLNVDGVSCYANASIQCLFALIEFRRSVHKRNSEINREIVKVMDHWIFSTELIRAKVDTTFTRSEQQDVYEFLERLFIKLDVDFTRFLEFSTAEMGLCTACQHPYARDEIAGQRFLLLNLPDLNSMSFQELLQFQGTVRTCDQCGSPITTRPNIVRVSKYVNVVFARYRIDINGQSVKVKTKISGCDPENITVDGHAFRIKCIIKHLGNLVTEGHYVSVIRHNNRWILCNDHNIQLSDFDSSLDDVYVMVLEKLS